MNFSRKLQSIKRQNGAAFIVMLVILILGVTAFLVSSLKSATLQNERDIKNAEVLAQAKEGLIGFAVSADLHTNPTAASPRPGNLPCPDSNNDGTADASCSGNALGHLPWKTLGLPDLRDSSGERLWYAVSSNFKKSAPYTCCLNSDTAGTITIRGSDGNIIYDASLGKGVVAVVIAPGDVLQRTDKTAPQDRSSTGVNVPENFLDIALGEDNANFTNMLTNGFIQGRIKDGSGNVILNDQLIFITQDNLMQPVQKRVAAEVKLCLNEYAADSQNNGRFPWTTDPTDATNYNDVTNKRFGRVPDTPFDRTVLNSGDQMIDTWRGNCNIISGSGWWLNWKELVFYGIASAYRPTDPPDTPSCGSCLAVNPPSATTDKQFVVIVAGKILPGQSRANNPDKGTLSNYLEGGNANGVTPFENSPISSTFNDVLIYQ